MKAEADALLGIEPVRYEKKGYRLLAVSRETLRRVYTLLFTHAVEGDVRYADRLGEEIDAVISFPDWNHADHFLDTAEMTHAAALAYDWLHDYWPDARRTALRDAIIAKGLRPGLEAYRTSGDSRSHWPILTNNWNVVCNAGLGIGALAVSHDDPELSAAILERSQGSIVLGAREFAAGGGYPEGVAYWGYALKYLVTYIAALRSAVGEDFGLGEIAGLRETGYFPLYLTGPTDLTFNYYDAAQREITPSELFWLAARFEEPVLSWWGLRGTGKRQADWSHPPSALLWYEPGSEQDPTGARLPLDRTFETIAVGSMRGGWDPDATFVAFKGGDNSTNHGDLDLGTFVLDALGRRWAADLGPDDYNLPGYWDRRPGGRRWSYYRKRAEGHNTVVVNPGAEADQDERGSGSIIGSSSSEDCAFTVLELRRAHPRILGWQRGFALFNERRSIVVQDEIDLDGPAELVWSMHTPARIAIHPDGRTATLELDGKSLIASLQSPEHATFVDLEARPLWFSPDPEGQSVPDDVRTLAIRLRDTRRTTIAVQLTPAEDGKARPRYHPDSLAGWLSSGRVAADQDAEPIPIRSAPVHADRLSAIRITAPSTLCCGERANLGVSALATTGGTSELATERIEYASSAPPIASVDSRGILRAHRVGTVTIAAIVTTADRRLLHARASLVVSESSGPGQD